MYNDGLGAGVSMGAGDASRSFISVSAMMFLMICIGWAVPDE